MKIFSKIVSSLILTAGLLSATPYEVDQAHSYVGFSVKHMMVSNTHGRFNTFSADIDFDEATKRFNKFSATISTASIDTGAEKRDAHLRDDDFFASDKFPTMTFVMTSYTQKKPGKDKGKMHGNLTIKGVTKAVTLEIDDIRVLGNKLGFEIEGEIFRTDFGMNWNRSLDVGFGNVVIGEKVKIAVDVEADRK